MTSEFKEAWQRVDPESKAKILYRSAVHEAGHAVAVWYLDQVRYLGRYFTMPHLHHVAISLEGGGVRGVRGPRDDAGGIVALGDRFPRSPRMPADYPVSTALVRRSVIAMAIAAMAGPIAAQAHDDSTYTRERWRDWTARSIENADDWRGHAADYEVAADDGEYVAEKLIPLLGRRWRLHLDRAFTMADRIVRGHQLHIETLATALIARGLIEGEEVEAIFREIRDMSAGHIRQRGPNSWQVKYEAGPRDPQTGERQTRTETVKGTKRDAQRRLRELLGAVDTGQHVDPSRLTVAALVAERIELWRASGRNSTRTAERRRGLLNHQIRRIGHIPIQALRTSDVEAWHAGLLAGGLAPRTIRDAHRLLVQALGDAVKHGLVVKNVARLQSPPKIRHQEVEIIPADMITPMLEKLAGHIFYPLVVTALYTGLRRGEQLALTWADVDLDAKVLRVDRALDETKAGVAVKPPKTKAGRRSISLPDLVVDVLRDQKLQQMELRLFLRAGRLPTDALVFPGSEGRHRVPHTFSTTWGRVARRLGLPKVSWHALRHTHASMLIAAKVDIATIAARLGHENVATTLSTYTHLFASDDRAAADAINALVG